jgi:flagellar biosynthesis protein FliQ
MPPQQQQNSPKLSPKPAEDNLEHVEEDVELSENENLELSTALNLAEDGDLNTLLVMELKRPLIIIALSIVFALPALNRSLLSFIPKLANDAGNMNFLGIIVKAILVGLLYYVLDKCF